MLCTLCILCVLCYDMADQLSRRVMNKECEALSNMRVYAFGVGVVRSELN